MDFKTLEVVKQVVACTNHSMAMRKDEHAIAKWLKCGTKKFCTADALCSCLSTMSPTDLDMELAGRRESSVH